MTSKKNDEHDTLGNGTTVPQPYYGIVSDSIKLLGICYDVLTKQRFQVEVSVLHLEMITHIQP